MVYGMRLIRNRISDYVFDGLFFVRHLGKKSSKNFKGIFGGCLFFCEEVSFESWWEFVLEFECDKTGM